MFNWFLRLLGIEEQKPASSKSSLLDSNAAKPAEAQPVKESPSEPEQKPEPEQKSQETVAATIEAAEPEPEPASMSLADEIPGLKANYIKVLTEAGFSTKAAIDKASDKELLALKGIGQATVKILRS